MKVTGIRELRANAAKLFTSGEPLLITRHGKISGLYVPLAEANRLPDNVRQELTVVIGKYLATALARKGVKERDIKKDFDAYRRRRPVRQHASLNRGWKTGAARYQ